LFVGNNVSARSKQFTDNMNKDGRVGFVFDDGIIRGFLFLSPSLEGDGTLELERIFVDPLMLGKGYGCQLEDFACKYAIKEGYMDICLWVLEGNRGARGFYEKAGYTQDGEKPGQYVAEIKQLRYIKDLRL